MLANLLGDLVSMSISKSIVLYYGHFLPFLLTCVFPGYQLSHIFDVVFMIIMVSRIGNDPESESNFRRVIHERVLLCKTEERCTLVNLNMNIH